MQLSGKQTTNVKVDVSTREIVDAIEELRNCLPCMKKYFGGSHIDSKGYWQIYEYTHPHNNEDVYKTGEKATEEELQFDNERKCFNAILMKIKREL